MVSITRRRFIAYSAGFAGLPHPLRALADRGEGFEPPAPDAAAVRKLASRTAGRVITPDSPDYELSRLVFNRAFDKHPALIVRCANADDIARALVFAQDQDLPAAVRGGGHSRAGLSTCDGGVLIDLSAMNRVDVDAGGRNARAQGGALTIHVDTATQRFGLATTLAGCPTVGIAGLTLGGGMGLLMAKYGAACDNLISAQLVTADARLTDTAFPLRQRGFELDIMGAWAAATDRARAVRWVETLRDNLKPLARGLYVNQLGETSEDLVRTAYGANYARLAAIKKKYDPHNILRSNQNIVPA